MIEIEINARVKDFSEIKKSLEEKQAVQLGAYKQIDIVFGHPKFLDENNFIIDGGLSARIRQKNDEIFVDFKEITRATGGIEMRCESHSMEGAKEFLEKLGFEEAFTTVNFREKYELNDFVVCLDNVEKLGKFIEVEKEIKDANEKMSTKKACEEKLAELCDDYEIIEKKYGDLVQEMKNKGEW